MKFYIRGFIFLTILFIQTGGVPSDVCESCKHKNECPQFGDMSSYQQQQWIKDFPCQTNEEAGDSPIPGFSTFAKGDYVCCPSAQVWGIKEDDKNSSPGTQNGGSSDDLRSHNVPQYLWYQNQPRNTFNPSDYELANILNNMNNIFYDGNNYGTAQCTPQRSPPRPESGCCGDDLSDGDRITDVQEFLQFKAPSSKFGSQYNPPRYPIYSRAKRNTDDELPEVTFEDRIAGGRETSLDQYPWTAFLSIAFMSESGIKNFACGGSLISSQFILTAAHCVVNENNKLVSVDVTLAEYDKRTFPRDCVMATGGKQVCIENVKIPVEEVIIHPNFIEQFLINDIALLRLQNFAPYTQYIRPICLPPINIDSPEFSNLPLATAGWGLNVSIQSDVKQFTVIHMVPKSDCRVHYNHLTEGHICASGKRNEDTCKGDSGGPLMMVYKGKYHVAGIVSGKTSAFHCGTPVPSLYTNVYNYLAWIRQYVY